MSTFHAKTGSLVTLNNGNKTAQRNHPTQEFNNGVVLSSDSLKENQLFEVRIDKKVNSWSGSIEIGVTTCDPANLNFPTSATGFREGTWVMSGCSILKDGHSIIEEYGRDLDQLGEGDSVGVLRTSAGVLHFFVNGMDQGQAATGLPNKLYAVVDMYGKCAQVTVVEDGNREIILSNDITNVAIAEAANFLHSNDTSIRLAFHERCGTFIQLTGARRTAERVRPLDEFNNGVVMTNRPLKDNEMFEIRVDRLVDKWSGSIEVGITTHNPGHLDFPATMTNMRSGTIMMSGCGILTNGKGTRREYGDYNLDELAEGDRIGLMRHSSGALHYYINDVDQGVASPRCPQLIWGVVDLYGMAVKVTIVDRADTAVILPANPVTSAPPVNLIQCASATAASNTRNNLIRQMTEDTEEDESSVSVERLTFHPQCGSHSAVMTGSRTAHRPNALDDFNNGVVLTARMLKPGEMFEVLLDKMVDKWAGSIEIGVTTHRPGELDFPSTMTNMRSGTWMMTGNGVMHNGTTVIDEYGQNLDRLKVNDRVGVIRKEDGTVNFFVNGIDQGLAASNVPGNVYGVIDLYGQAAQATIIDHSDPLAGCDFELSLDTDPNDLGFHHLHGKNARISANGKSASRPNARGEFNDAIVISNRCLGENELFEVSVDKMVDRWSGAIEAGVTLIQPEDLDFPNTMTDIDYDTWMLSGSSIMQDGSTIRNGYRLDLDTLTAGSRIGMMRTSEGNLHFYLDGQDQGVASTDIPSGVFAVIDLYGQCAQVTVTSGSGVRAPENRLSGMSDHAQLSPVSPELRHRFSQCCGKNVTIQNNGCTACRVRNFNHGLVFSAEPLRPEELFEVKVDSVCKQWSGSLLLGLTTLAISDSTPISVLPSTAHDLTSKVTWVVSGSEVRKNGVMLNENYAPSLERLEVGNRVGVKRCADGTMHVYINGEDMGVAATNVPKNVFGLVDLYGMVDAISVTSSVYTDTLSNSQPLSALSPDTSNSILEAEQDEDTAEPRCLEFHSNHGKNVALSCRNMTAQRTASYNQGIVVTNKPLPRNTLFQVRIDKLTTQWTSSVMLGVLGFQPDKVSLPVSALAFKKQAWLVHGDAVFHTTNKIRDQYGPNIDSLRVGHTVGVLVDDDSCLRLYVNGVDQGVAARDIPVMCYAFIDLYGQCQQVSVVTRESESCRQPHDYREKADMEDGIKEKKSGGLSSTGPTNKTNKNCEYQNMCARFKASLALPDGYFISDHNCCFCETCHKVRGDEAYGRRGDPAKEYAQPFGWCKFGLKIPAKAEASNILDKWHVAYHGTQTAALRKILDTGDCMLGDLHVGEHSLTPHVSHCDEKNKPEEEQHISPVLLSPTVRYAGCQNLAPKYDFRDTKSRKQRVAQVVMQVCVKPGSYKVGPPSTPVPANHGIDPRFHHADVEWSTKERGATVLAALLVKIE